jgi:stress-induced morphogen
MALPNYELEEILQNAFPDAKLRIVDMAGDQDHYFVEITSERFRGHSRVNQHKIFNEAIKGTPAASIHALSIKTLVP